MEALEPGKPLTFLDHHIQCGNSLLGCTPALLKKGIPDAAFTPLTGDDKDYCNKYRRLNREESKGDMLDIFSGDEKPWEHLGNHSPFLINLNKMDDSDIESLQKKEAAYAELMLSSGYLFSKFIFDSWCAAFVWKKAPSDLLPYPITQQLLDKIETNPYSVNPVIRTEIMHIAEEYQFFHWHVAFPDVFIAKMPNEISDKEITGWTGGFDCILGNPPWERVKLQEKEFFAARDESIAKALNASVRKKMIEDLPQTNPSLYEQFLSEKRKSEGSSGIIREGGFFPLCGRGDLNTYTVFAELNRILLAANGNSGCIVPSGIATDDTTKFFFQDLFDNGSLKSLYDFENRENIFPAVDSRMKFCLLTMRGLGLRAIAERSIADFLFFAHNLADLSDSERHFQLSKDDIALINPNTRTCPIFRSKQDAELTKYVYYRVPVLNNENEQVNVDGWHISFMRMFDMANDSHLFRTIHQMDSLGFVIQGNVYIRGDETYLPLYEPKLIYAHDYRYSTFADVNDADIAKGNSEYLTPIEKGNPQTEIVPRYWVKENLVFEHIGYKFSRFLLGYRGVTATTNERTLISSIFPISAVQHNMWLLFLENEHHIPLFASMLNTFIVDFITRQKMSSYLNQFVFKQLPFLYPSIDTHPTWLLLGKSLTNWILELLYTSYSLQPFAFDCGYDGPPIIWDEERRFAIRCELDALYFHLYLGTLSDWQTQGTPELLAYLPTPRHAVEYIMETFPIVKRKDLRDYGTYRTKLRILEIYDQMTHCLATNTEYRSTLNPPPGPPCDSGGNFIPVDKWDNNNWPTHIHHNPLSGEVHESR